MNIVARIEYRLPSPLADSVNRWRIRELAIALGAVILALTGLATDARAEIVFDNNANPNTAYFSDAGSSGQRIYDEFVLSPSGSTDVNVAVWTGVYGRRNVVPDNFSIRFYANSGTVPGTLITSLNVGQVQRQQTGTLNLGNSSWDIYEYRADFSRINFNPSQRYWISITNNTSQGWAWLADNRFGRIAFQTSPTGRLFNATSAMDFQLESTPEPGSLILFLIGLTPLLRRQRRPPPSSR